MEDYEEDYEELLDDAQDEMDEGQELKEAQMDSYGTYPDQKQHESAYQWFWKIVRLKKPFQLLKVGNLTNPEIGQHTASVRDCMNLWILGHQFRHPTFGDYFANQAKITATTSMSKLGWFMELTQTQKKIRERKRQSSVERFEKWKFRKKPARTEEET